MNTPPPEPAPEPVPTPARTAAKATAKPHAKAPAKKAEGGTPATTNPPEQPDSLTSLIHNLETGHDSWANQTRPTKLRLATHVLQELAAKWPNDPISMALFDQNRPAWMPSMHGVLVAIKMPLSSLLNHALPLPPIAYSKGSIASSASGPNSTSISASS